MEQPSGFELRTVTMEVGAARIYNEAEWRAHTAHVSEQFDPSRDLAVAEVDGRVVAVAGQDWVDTRDGAYREHRLWGCVEPGFRRRGIGAAMLRDNERRAAELAATHDTPRPHTYAGWASDGRPGSRLLDASGYELVRWSHRDGCARCLRYSRRGPRARRSLSHSSRITAAFVNRRSR